MFPPEDGLVANDSSHKGGYIVFSVVERYGGGAKGSLHLVAEPAAGIPTVALNSRAGHEAAKTFAKHEHAQTRAHGLGADPGQQQVRQVPAGEPGGSDRCYCQGEGAVGAHEVGALPLVGAR